MMAWTRSVNSENGMVGAGHGDEGRVCFEADERASHRTRDECMRDAPSELGFVTMPPIESWDSGRPPMHCIAFDICHAVYIQTQ